MLLNDAELIVFWRLSSEGTLFNVVVFSGISQATNGEMKNKAMVIYFLSISDYSLV